MATAPGEWSGFHRLGRAERARRLRHALGLSSADMAAITHVSALPPALSEAFVENSLGGFPIPLGVAMHFVVDGAPVLVPMAVEESSVVAAASHGAKLVAAGGGFRTTVMEPVTVGQVELRDVKDAAKVRRIVKANQARWRERLDALAPRMVARGGGVRHIKVRTLPGHRVVLHVGVDTRDSMGANAVNTLCEWLGPVAARATGARLGLCILTNLADERLATARAIIPAGVLGRGVAKAIVAANDFAAVDPYRAATHNKGILNGIDPVLVATGNDWRAVEAGAHAYAARGGRYGPLTTYKVGARGALHASITLPMAVGTVGGVTRLHPTARALLKAMGHPDSRRLAAICASVGLAQNLAALRALATEGIQKGHMRLHGTNRALAADPSAPP